MSTTEEIAWASNLSDAATTFAGVDGGLNGTGNSLTDDEVFEEFRDMQFVYQQLDKIVLIVCYLPVFLLAVVANTLVIVVVLKFHYMRSITNYFLVNLSVADLLVTLICMPMAVGQSVTRLWLYSEPMCKLTYYLQGVAVGASVFTITAMSIDRYLAIRHPMAFRNIFNRKTTLVMIVVLWGVALAIFAPLLWVRKTEDPLVYLLPFYPRRVYFCSEIWETNHRMIYGTFCFVAVYAVPGIVIMLAYSLMGRQLCSVSPPFEGDPGMAGTEQGTRLVRERRRVARILLLLATLFALCWLPYNVLSLCLDLGYHDKNLVDAIPFALLLGHANSAINPILYCFMTKNFRRTVKEVLVKSKASLAERQHQRRKRHHLERLRLVPQPASTSLLRRVAHLSLQRRHHSGPPSSGQPTSAVQARPLPATHCVDGDLRPRVNGAPARAGCVGKDADDGAAEESTRRGLVRWFANCVDDRADDGGGGGDGAKGGGKSVSLSDAWGCSGRVRNGGVGPVSV